MASETIREFLVKLGYQNDDAGLKKFELGIGKATKAVFALAAAIEATAVGVAAGVARFASNLESLYFASQRTGSSATQLRALDQAARSLGAHAGEAIAGVEGLASALRLNPGNVGLLVGLLGKLGLQTKNNADGSINAADALLKLTQVFKTMPFFQAAQFAQQLGISSDLLFKLTQGDLAGKYAEQLSKMGGGLNEGAEDAHKLMDDIRDLGEQFEMLGVAVERALKQKLGFNLKDVTNWMRSHRKDLAKDIAEAAVDILTAAQKIAEGIGWVIDKLKDWDKETGGLSTKLIGWAVLLKATGVGSVIGGILSLAGAFNKLAIAVAPADAVLATFLAGYEVFKAATEDQNVTAGTTPNIIKFKNWVNDLLPDWAKQSAGIINNNPGNLLYTEQPNAARIGDYAAFGTPSEGFATLGQLIETLGGGKGRNTVSAIIKALSGESAGGGDLAGFIKDVAGRTGFGPDQALNLKDPNTLAALMNAVTWHMQGSNPYQPGTVLDAAKRATISVQQTTTIHVNGAADPDRVAGKVAAHQKEVNRDLMRNVGVGAVR